MVIEGELAANTVLTEIEGHKSKFAPFFPSGFMIEELNQFNLNGSLSPAEQWSWFYSEPQPKMNSNPSIASLFQLGPPPY